MLQCPALLVLWSLNSLLDKRKYFLNIFPMLKISVAILVFVRNFSSIEAKHPFIAIQLSVPVRSYNYFCNNKVNNEFNQKNPFIGLFGEKCLGPELHHLQIIVSDIEDTLNGVHLGGTETRGMLDEHSRLAHPLEFDLINAQSHSLV